MMAKGGTGDVDIYQRMVLHAENCNTSRHNQGGPATMRSENEVRSMLRAAKGAYNLNPADTKYHWIQALKWVLEK